MATLKGTGQSSVKRTARLPALFCVLQNEAAPSLIDKAPFFDLLQRSKAAETGQFVVQAAIAYTRGLSGAVDVTHLMWNAVGGIEFEHTGARESEQCITREAVMRILSTSDYFSP